MRKGPSMISCLMLLLLLLLTSACLAASPSIRTEMSNAGSTMMAHSASTDQSLTTSAEYEASSTSSMGGMGDTQSSASSKSVMQIDESIVSGRATFSVISGGGGSGTAGGGRGESAWKSPKIEIEEEYIGTYHISKSFAVNESHVLRRDFDGWLNFWMLPNSSHPAISGLFNLTGNASRSLPDAEEVFGNRR